MLAKVRTFLIRHPLINGIYEKTKHVSLPGFQGVPIYDVVAFVNKEIHRDAISIRAGSISFSFLLAMFPFLIFILNLLPFFNIPNLDVKMLLFLNDVLPKQAFEMVNTTFIDIVNNQRTGLLSIGFVLAVYYASGGVSSIMKSFDKIYPTFKKRGYWESHLVAFKILILVASSMILSVILIIAGEYLVNLLLDLFNITNKFTYVFLTILRIFIMVLLFFNIYSLIYYYGPAMKQKWHFFSPGATLATILTISTSLMFAWYVNNFPAYNTVYGSLGTLIVLMLWVYFNSFILLIGFELNASIDINKNLREGSYVADENI